MLPINPSPGMSISIPENTRSDIQGRISRFRNTAYTGTRKKNHSCTGSVKSMIDRLLTIAFAVTCSACSHKDRIRFPFGIPG